ncbi:hypothetical protein IL306_006673 [Fusarium sp. DS 682]|nr:hypothetical protein IL306_006673 [Fusarium sp. DS 682]
MSANLPGISTYWDQPYDHFNDDVSPGSPIDPMALQAALPPGMDHHQPSPPMPSTPVRTVRSSPVDSWRRAYLWILICQQFGRPKSRQLPNGIKSGEQPVARSQYEKPGRRFESKLWVDSKPQLWRFS